jgi:hypothetical protein
VDSPRRPSLTSWALVAALASGCGAASPASPSSAGAVATIRVVDELFRVSLTTPDQVDAARRAQSGGPARIPSGRIVVGTAVNTGWKWHLEDIVFVETAIEICDGRPSDVERFGPAFGGGRFCPWSATVIAVDP